MEKIFVWSGVFVTSFQCFSFWNMVTGMGYSSALIMRSVFSYVWASLLVAYGFILSTSKGSSVFNCPLDMKFK